MSQMLLELAALAPALEEEGRVDLTTEPNGAVAPTEEQGFLGYSSPEKGAVLKRVREDGLALEKASTELRADRDIALEAVKQNAWALQYAGRELRADKEIVLEAVKQDGWVLQCASRTLRADKGVVQAAVKHSGLALKFASGVLRADKDVVMEAVKTCGWALQFTTSDNQKDKEIVMEAVKDSPQALQYAALVRQIDEDIVLEAVKQGGSALQYADRSLRESELLVQTAVEQYGCALQYASERLRADRNIVVKAVKQDGRAMPFASDDLQGDKDLLLIATRSVGLGAYNSFFVKLAEVAKAILRSPAFQGAQESAIAIPGEDGPILSLALSRTIGADSANENAPQRMFLCEVSLMSGVSFRCTLPADTRSKSPSDPLSTPKGMIVKKDFLDAVYCGPEYLLVEVGDRLEKIPHEEEGDGWIYAWWGCPHLERFVPADCGRIAQALPGERSESHTPCVHQLHHERRRGCNGSDALGLASASDRLLANFMQRPAIVRGKQGFWGCGPTYEAAADPISTKKQHQISHSGNETEEGLTRWKGSRCLY